MTRPIVYVLTAAIHILRVILGGGGFLFAAARTHSLL